MKNKINHLVAFASPLFLASAAMAQDGGASDKGYYALAAAIAISIAAGAGALGQGRAAGAALEGIARNPSSQNKVFVPFILGLALIESLVIFALLVAFQLIGKIN